LQANAVPAPICHGHEPQLHCTKRQQCKVIFQQHFTTFASTFAAGHGAEYPSGATGWRVEETDIVCVILQGYSQSLCWLFPRMNASRNESSQPGGFSPASDLGRRSVLRRRAGYDGGTLAATPRRTTALRPPEPPNKPPPTEPPPCLGHPRLRCLRFRLRRRRRRRRHRGAKTEVSQWSDWVAGSKGKCRVRHSAFFGGAPRATRHANVYWLMICYVVARHVTCECRPADEDEIEKALRKISKFMIFDLQKIVNFFC